MEDLQKQHNGEGTPRRRRAVRSVPMGTERAQQPSVLLAEQPVRPDVLSVPEVPTEDEAAVLAVEKTESDVDAVDVKEEEAAAPDGDILYLMSDETPAAEDEENCVDVPMPEPADVTAEEPKDTAAQSHKQVLFEDTDSFAAIKTFGAEEPSSGYSRRGLWAAVGLVAVLVLICAAVLIPLRRQTQAVMLYVDDTAVGYIASAEDAGNEFSAVVEDLRDSAFDAQIVYRCETEAVSGGVSLISSDDIYDAMYAQATEGYVRAYRLYAEDGSISYAFGVMTEAEILSAIDAAIAVCRERYSANLPADAVLSVVPCFAWETAWMAEDAILNEGALMSRIVEAQNSEYPMLSASATVTETEAERLPYETTLVPNDENFDGIRTMISPGADGLAQVSYTVELNPQTGEVLSRTEQSRTVVREPVSAVSYEGVYPLPDGVSTGTFAWPLPELPDDEMPLDENGEPYMPENTLALKNTYVSSGYGERDLWGSYDFHLGLDIVAPAYTEIYAADGGVVVYAAHTSSYGYMTRIRHANNVETVYAHQYKLVARAGDVVEKGQLIGYVGSTGTSSGNHLHLEFRRDHVTVDPLEYIEIPEDVYVLGSGN